MADTPETWLDDVNVNQFTSGSRSPRVTQLASGNILVVWTSDDPFGVGAPGGADVIGQMFDPLGNPIGEEFLVNSFFANDEQNADVAALPGGGFLTVFEDFSVSADNQSIRLTERTADGSVRTSITVRDDPVNAGDPGFFSPRVAVSSATSALVVYVSDGDTATGSTGADSDIMGRIYDSTTGTVGAEISLMSSVANAINPDIAVLTNGSYAIVAEDTRGLENRILLRMVSATGQNVLGVLPIAITSTSGFDLVNPSVTALSGDRFVVVWTEISGSDIDVVGQVFTSAGAGVSGIFTVSERFDDSNNTEPVVVALPDGGFLVAYDDNLENTTFAQRHDAAGNAVGFPVAISGGFVASEIDAVALADGRVALSFRVSANEIRMQILDTRDAANDPGVYVPDGWQIGTIGADTITSDGAAAFVAGHDGDDILNTGESFATYLGGAGNDLINVNNILTFEVWDGGAGVDAIDFTTSRAQGMFFDLGAGTATFSALTLAMTGFESLTGTVGDDTIIGLSGESAERLEGGEGDDDITGRNSGSSRLFGGGGNDRVSGGGSNPDTQLFGGDGNDTLTGDQGTLPTDRLFGGDGDDSLFHTGQFAEAHGDAGNDRITVGGLLSGFLPTSNGGQFGDSGDDVFLARESGFIGEIFGGTDTDTLDLSAVTAANAYAIDLAAGISSETGETLAGVVTVTASLEEIENVTGSGAADRITGSSAANTLAGGAGDDLLTGGAGADSLAGEDGRDTVTGGIGTDRISGGGDDDRLFGGSANDTLTGDGGADILFGGVGNDLLVVGTSGTNSAGETYDGDVGSDTISFAGAGSSGYLISLITGTADIISGGFAVTLAGIENVTGNDAGDRIFGNGGVNVLDGGAGNDTLFGSAGDDRLVGGLGSDTLNGGTGRDAVSGGEGDDAITLADLDDATVAGDAGSDLLTLTLSVAFRFDMITGAVTGTGPLPVATWTGFENYRNASGLGSGEAVLGTEGGNAISFAGTTGTHAVNARGGDDSLTGGSGSDTLNGGTGNDTMLGGAGNDTYLVDAAGDGVFETTTLTGSTDAGGTDTVQSAVSLTLDSTAGLRFVETLTLTGTADSFGFGNALANRVTGNAGDNFLNGGAGRDLLTGDTGRDGFIFSAALVTGNIDRITDFSVPDDTIRLDDAVFAGLTRGRLSGSAFAANDTGLATDPDDRIIYETDTGRLFLDSDGAGGADGLLFATLTAGLALTNLDVFVF